MKQGIEDRIDDFEEHVQAIRARRTAQSYAQGAFKFELFLEKRDIDLSKAPPGLLDAFVRWMITDLDLRPNTIKLWVHGAQRYLEWRRGLGEELPNLKTPEVPRVKDKEPFALDARQLAQFFVSVDRQLLDPSRSALLIMPFCGLRSTELVNLQMNQISRMNSKKAKKAFTVFRFSGKGDKIREVPLLGAGEKVLISYLRGFRAEPRFNGNPYLFPGKGRSEHMSSRTLRDNVSIIKSEMDLTELTPHNLRKTYASALERAGVGPLKIAHILGHANVQTTYKHYIHQRTEDLLDSVDGVDILEA